MTFHLDFNLHLFVIFDTTSSSANFCIAAHVKVAGLVLLPIVYDPWRYRHIINKLLCVLVLDVNLVVSTISALENLL